MEDLIAKLRGLRDDLFSVRGHGWTILDDALRALSDVPPDGIVKRSIDMQRRAETAEATLTAQAAEIERLTKERDAEALSADKFREVWSRADRHRQEVETERDALKAENQKLREALLAAKDALSASSFIYFQHAPNDSWRSGYKRDMGKIDAALQSGEER